MSTQVAATKQQLNWRTEWSEASALWLRWPYRRDIWPQSGEAAQADVRAFLSILSDLNVPVALQVHPDAPMPSGLPTNVRVHSVPFGDVWIRDCAPFVDCDQKAALHYRFDGWGGIDDQFKLDVTARDWLSSHLGLTSQAHDLVLEGGALHHDGEGTALACSGSILFRPTNSGLTARALHTHVKEFLGIEKLLLVPGKLTADETGGHIDNIACFLAPGVVAVASTDDPAHPDYATCRRVVDFLQTHTDAQGRSLKLIKLPLPRAPRLSAAEAVSIEHRLGVRKRIAGMQLMASYVNFARVRVGDHDVILLPAYGLPQDERALEIMVQTMAEIQPTARVVSVSARGLLVGGGSWHCATLAL
ncbi:agmatine deiminase family protein [Aliidiomarina sanyensis]|uniref:Agmatine deiminase n=1 Tax=Aliidiomarina sanyensis TaxID=1249555 RepID=A0A432WND9_9GAMM|nr:agmatine deiminase family protein [Aliidiomarina sanyensis]RUO35294.1 hypothetical protein CWE11_04530 [Aliidiomarina sanyensis]